VGEPCQTSCRRGKRAGEEHKRAGDADHDRRDLRESSAVLKGEDVVGGVACWRVEVSPAASDSVYGRLDICVRKDNSVPVQWSMFARSGTLMKTLVAKEVRQVGGRWFIVRSVMTNHAEDRETELVCQSIPPPTTCPITSSLCARSKNPDSREAAPRDCIQRGGVVVSWSRVGAGATLDAALPTDIGQCSDPDTDQRLDQDIG
jgi:hypothetical protein